MSGLAKFHVSVNTTGQAVVEINGQSMEGAVQGFTLQSRTGQPPLMVLQQLASDVEIEGEGIVHVSTQGVDSKEAVLGFLNEVDAEELEQAVLGSMGWGENNTMAVAIDILRKWARERTAE